MNTNIIEIKDDVIIIECDMRNDVDDPAADFRTALAIYLSKQESK